MEAWKEALVAYVFEHGDSLDFTLHFWKGCEPTETDVIQYHKFTSALKLLDKGVTNVEIATDVGASTGTISTWKNLVRLPKLAHYLKAHLILSNPPSGRKWLTTECSHGYGIPVGEFLCVPLRIDSWDQMAEVLYQFRDLNEAPIPQSRDYQLGFLLGIMMGDAAKSKSNEGASHRHIGLVLSKKYRQMS